MAGEEKKAQRRSGAKVRRGCATCRARHIKCDENKPACQQCAAGKWTCEYPELFRSVTLALSSACRTTSPDIDNAIELTSALSNPPETNEQRRFYQFRHSILANWIGIFHEWSTEILRMCGHSTPLRQAAATLTALYDSGNIARAQNMYTKVVQSVRKRIAAPESIEEILVACFLFIYIELLRQDDVAAVKHVEGGLHILTSNYNLKAVDCRIHSLLSALLGIFTRVDNATTCLIGSRAPRLIGLPTLSPSQGFATLQEARSCLDRYQVEALNFLTPPYGADECLKGWSWHPQRGADVYSVFHGSNYSGYVSVVDIDCHRHRLIELLLSWRRRFQSLVGRLDENQRDHVACAAAWLQYLPTIIKIKVAFKASEVLYNAEILHFEEVLAHAEVFLDATSALQRRPLALDSNVIYPLYFTLLKCRARRLRLRALDLLGQCGQESAWEAGAMARVGELVMQLEEGTDPDAIPEERRIHCVGLNVDKGSRRAWVTFNPKSLEGDWNVSYCQTQY